MENFISIASHISEIRRKYSPRTSYATAGSAATDLYVCAPVLYASAKESGRSTYSASSTGSSNTTTDHNTDIRHSLSCLCEELVRTKEFTTASYHETLNEVVSGHVVLLVYNSPDIENINDILQAVFTRTRLCFMLFWTGNISKQSNDRILNIQNLIANSFPNNKTESFKYPNWYLIDCYQPNLKKRPLESSSITVGFNGQASVQSRQQFKYVWQSDTSTIDVKDRVLQRLVSKNVKRKGSHEIMNSNDWDRVIQSLINSNKNDWDIYSIIRELTLGKSLEESLSSTEIASENKAESNDDEANGRSNFMVRMILDCIPKTSGSGKVHRMLDYGCAEGAITASLGSALLLKEKDIFGADVRAIPSPGFTFLHLKSEEQLLQEGYRMFPQIGDESIDLINASMVFHHVTNIYHVLLELRRILSPNGCLILREHLCDSSYMAAFLDITHGLYSLAWSSPVEWPHFLDEYEAFYRDRKTWTEIMAICGFQVLEPSHADNSNYSRLYYSADKSRRKHDGSIPNIIKAYYATYIPRKDFDVSKVPSHLLRSQMKSSSSDADNKSLHDADREHHADKRSKAESLSVGSKGEGSNRVSADSLHQAAPKTSHECKVDPRQVLVTKPSESGNKSENVEAIEIFESSKHPGQYYYSDKSTNRVSWVTIHGEFCVDTLSGIKYKIAKLVKKT